MHTNLDPKTLFKDVDTDRPVLAAVSGGSDSIAMLLLVAAWAKHVNADVQVVTVDHGLRPEAAAEAAFVASLCEGLGLPHVTLAWDGMKPDSGIIQAARNARYRLMEEFAADIGAGTILVAHTANDQAETILMRNARSGEGVTGRGLSGMAPVMLLPARTRLMRPLLKFKRETLRHYLRSNHQSWIEDPSNSDQSYERVRVRAELQGADARIARICRFSEVMGKHRKLVATAVAKLLSEHLTVTQGPVYSLPEAILQGLPAELKLSVLQVLVSIAGGSQYFVPANSLERLFLEDGDGRITAGNAVLECRSGALRVYREKRNLPAILIGAGDVVVWDGRFLIENKSATSYFCGTLTSGQVQEIEQDLGRKLGVRPRAALGATPCLRGDGDDLVLPCVNGFTLPPDIKITLIARAIEYFCPEYDFPLLDFVEDLKVKASRFKPQKG